MGKSRSAFKISSKSDFELLLLRIALGVMFMIHGWPKMKGGPDKWVMVGAAMGNVGIHFFPVFWGFMAALAEFGGGLFFALGIVFRPMAFLMMVTMAVAAMFHFNRGDGINGASHAVELFFVLTFFFSRGPGRLSLGNLFHRH